MTEILILHNIFNYKLDFLPKILARFINYYNENKIRSLIKKLIKKYGKNANITIISGSKKKIYLKGNYSIKLLSDIRINLDRDKYLNIKQKTIKNTKNLFTQLYNNLIKIKSTYLDLKHLFIPKLLEFDLVNYFNTYFGSFAIIRNYIQKEYYDQLIFFNCYPHTLELLQDLRDFRNRIQVFNDTVLNKTKNILKLICFSHFIMFILGTYFKRKFYKIFKQNEILKPYVNNSILFVVKTKNQLKSVQLVYNNLKMIENGLNPIYYFIEIFLNPRDILKLFRFLFHLRRSLCKNKKKISLNLEYNSIDLKNILKIFDGSQFFIKFAYLFNYQKNLKRFIENRSPKLVVIGNDFKDAERVVAGYFKSKKIPTLFIPHAAIPIIEEFVSKPDIMYYVLGGELDKAYYVNKGIPPENIEIVGIPRYENLYKGEITKLNLIEDMFSGASYNFSKQKFTILLTTNPIDDESNEKIITSVVNSLKQLNLIDNLIIKLHPHENGKIHREVLQKLNVNPVIVKSYNILDLIKSCDLLISQKSTTLLEAMIVGTPMILLDFINKGFRESSKYGFLNEKFIPTAKDQQSFTEEIKRIMESDRSSTDFRFKQKDFAAKFSYYDQNDPPIQKIVNFILKIRKK